MKSKRITSTAAVKSIIQSPTDVHSIDYNRNYLRNSIIALIRYKKPVIVTGILQFNPYEYYYSFVNIKPFFPEYENQLRILCQHVNIGKRQVDAVLNLYGSNDYTQKPLVLICKPYVYRLQQEGEDRGGLNLTAELGIPGIMTYENALKTIPNIDPKKYVDFTEFGGGYFLGINPVQQKQQKSMQKHQKRTSIPLSNTENTVEEIINTTDLTENQQNISISNNNSSTARIPITTISTTNNTQQEQTIQEKSLEKNNLIDETEHVLFTTQNGVIVKDNEPIFNISRQQFKEGQLNQMNISYLINRIQLPKVKKEKNTVHMLDGWLLKI